MQNLFLLISFSILSISQAWAQDQLFFLTGKEQEVKITEVSSVEVKYKRMDNLDGPTFSTLKAELFMIKYASGTKELIQHSASAPTIAPSPSSSPTTKPSSNQTQTNTESVTSNSGLSTAIQVEETQTHSTSKSKTDRYGRTRDENLRLRKKRLVGGGVAMGIGGATLITGTVLLVQGVRFNNLFGSDPAYVDHPAHNYDIIGGILMAAGTGVTILGAGLLGSSKKYKRRAAELANSGFDLNPTLINDYEYAGTTINSNNGYGFRLTYNF